MKAPYIIEVQIIFLYALFRFEILSRRSMVFDSGHCHLVIAGYRYPSLGLGDASWLV